jgi:hypothetical protein
MLIEVVPTNIVAGAAGFARRDFFEIENKADREAPQVKF